MATPKKKEATSWKKASAELRALFQTAPEGFPPVPLDELDEEEQEVLTGEFEKRAKKLLELVEDD